MIVRQYVDKVAQGPLLRERDADGLVYLAQEMDIVSTTLASLRCRENLDRDETLGRIAARLPLKSQDMWIHEAEMLQRRGRDPTFEDLAAFVDIEAQACSSYFGRVLGQPRSNQSDIHGDVGDANTARCCAYS